MAHNLKIRAENVQWSVDEALGRLEVVVNADSLKVECARVDGRDDAQALTVSDKAKIDDNMHQKVLETHRFPEIRFRATRLTEGVVEGELSLHGITRPLRFPWKRENGFYVAEAEFNQRDFGIKPFVAMMGALKVSPQVKVLAKFPVSNSFVAR